MTTQQRKDEMTNITDLLQAPSISKDAPSSGAIPPFETTTTAPSGDLAATAADVAALEAATTVKIQTVREPEVSYSSPTKSCIRRIQGDLGSLLKDPIEGILAVPDQERVNVVHALITGPIDTPYEYGFFLFKMEFPDSYPHVPPRVTLMTTGGGTVRFNPNLYGDGKVCLSILGTWSGPAWSPVHTISSILLSIQSLMNSNPYRNEPGFEHESIHSTHVRQYNQYLRYQTIRVAVLEMVEEAHTALLSCIPTDVPPFASLVRDMFQETAEALKLYCDEYAFLDGTGTCSQLPLYFCGSAGRQFKFDFGGLRRRVERLEQSVLSETY